MKRAGFSVAVACLVAALAATPASASGFSIYEQSAKASGMAGAWVARADDAAANWYNPASLVRQPGMQFQFGTNFITIGADTTFTVDDPAFGISTPTKFDAESSIGTPSHLYFAQRVNDRIAWGVGLNNPYGLVSEWKDAPIVFSARKSELVTWVLNPNVAFKVGPQWSLAVGIDYMYADVAEFSRDVLLDISNPPDGVPERLFSNLTGDGDDWGFNVAAQWQGESWSFGASYRSEMAPKIEGDLDTSFMGTSIRKQVGSADLDLPAQAAIGFACTAVENWSFEVDVAWAGWSSFEEIRIEFESPMEPDTVLREDWDDTYSYRFGAAWDLAERHQFRFGVVYDEAPSREDTLRPSIPDAPRTGLSIGYGFSGAKWSIDGYYMALQFDDADANGNPLEGVIDGRYESFTNLLGATFNVRWGK